MHEETSPTSLKTHLRNFALSTSVRGIPRAAKADDKVLSALWTIAVVCCSGVLVHYTKNTLSKYLSYGVVTSIKEANENVVNCE